MTNRSGMISNKPKKEKKSKTEKKRYFRKCNNCGNYDLIGKSTECSECKKPVE